MLDSSECRVFHPDFGSYMHMSDLSLYFAADGYIYHNKMTDPVRLNKTTLLSGGYEDYQKAETRKGECMGILWYEMVRDGSLKGSFRVKGIRLHQIHWLEELRWKVMCHQRDIVIPQYQRAYDKVKVAGGCDGINEYGNWSRISPTENGIAYGSEQADPENPLNPEVGKEWFAAERRAAVWNTRLRKVEIVMEKVMREHLPKTRSYHGRCSVLINGRRYLWKQHGFYWERDSWPDPTLYEVDLG